MTIARPHTLCRLPALLLMLGLGLIACTAKDPVAKGKKAAIAADFIGDWAGDLKTPVGKLALVLHVHQEDGQLVSVLDSPDQNAFGIKAEESAINDGALVVKLPALKAKITLRVLDDNTLGGKFHQGIGLKLVLTRQEPGAKPVPLVRPQTPKPPFVYQTEEVIITSNDGTLLAATLSVPKGPGPFAAVVMITGSGPQDRDETILGHKSFAVLADALARAGIATLRADDRDVAKSGGDFSIATEQDFAADARALRAFLKDRPQINQSQVGYLGHSEGGIIAPMAASGADDIAFLVLIAGPAKPLGAVIVDQIKTFSPNTAELPAALAVQKKIYTALRSEKDHDALIADLKAIIMKSGANEDTAKTQAEIAASP
jgi:alpha/beta superfamily hydrolase